MIAGAVAAIFMYHHVSTVPAGGPYGRALTVTPQEFVAQLRYLDARGCAAVSLGRLVEDVRSGKQTGCEVALTFDDGYEDAATEAAPLMRGFGDVGTFFVTTGFIGTVGHLTQSQIRGLTAEGMEIGAHTVSHTDLTKLSAEKAGLEVRGSRIALQALTGQSIGGFAYPSGRTNRSVESVVRSAGFAYAVTTLGGRLTPGGLARDPLTLPRYRVEHGTGEALFRAALGAAPAATPSMPAAEVRSIARSRTEGNAPGIAERVAVALLDGAFPESILKVRVLALEPATVAGIMLSGEKFHERVDRAVFAADVSAMLDRAFAADPQVSEVDVWAVVPIQVEKSATVSGDLAVPTERTVFSAAVTRARWLREDRSLGVTYWEPGWLQDGRP
jgi:peptidoglycan/xylan/chitin deacetylase (PgdA/CDA1 family)